uniref:Uncharacterized protein n=1 Tax=Arundo donax TaxID=35708 RepID=A0A0A9FQD8_ARUDO
MNGRTKLFSLRTQQNGGTRLKRKRGTG